MKGGVWCGVCLVVWLEWLCWGREGGGGGSLGRGPRGPGSMPSDAILVPTPVHRRHPRSHIRLDDVSLYFHSSIRQILG